MPDKHAATPRRVVRRRRARAWQGATAWLDLIRINPRRVPLHLLALTAGLAAVLVTTLAGRPAVTPTASSDPSGVTDQTAQASGPVETAASEAVSSAVAPAEAAPQLRTHVVEAGDTLRALAEQYGVSMATIAVANGLADPDRISIGQELTIPPTTGLLAAAKPGETLGQLAERYGVDVPSLAGVNQLAPVADQPVVGSKVVVPGIEPELALPSNPKPPSAEGQTVAEASPSRGLASVIITPENSSESAEAEQPARSKPPVIYEVQEGDSIRSLANQFGVSTRTILLANNISDPDLIKPGMELRVLPVSGVEHEVEPGESVADIAAAYKVDLGPIVDFNGLSDPDTIKVGAKIVIPGATARVAVAPPAPQPRIAPQSPSSAVAAIPQAGPSGAPAAAKPSRQSSAAAAPAAAAPAPAAPARAVPAAVVGAGGAGIVKNAMAYSGYRYVFGGSSPAGFDCSGFVWYVHKAAGINISRGLWGQLNGGPRISRENLQPGDTVFFANTYMPGLSHVGIYVGGGSFIHAIDEGSGVGVSSLSSSYWGSRYIGAARLY